MENNSSLIIGFSIIIGFTLLGLFLMVALGQDSNVVSNNE